MRQNLHVKNTYYTGTGVRQNLHVKNTYYVDESVLPGTATFVESTQFVRPGTEWRI